MPDQFTPEEFEILANSPADTPIQLDDPSVPAEAAPEGVVESDEDDG